jgi:hypothetical protein
MSSIGTCAAGARPLSLPRLLLSPRGVPLAVAEALRPAPRRKLLAESCVPLSPPRRRLPGSTVPSGLSSLWHDSDQLFSS